MAAQSFCSRLMWHSMGMGVLDVVGLASSQSSIILSSINLWPRTSLHLTVRSYHHEMAFNSSSSEDDNHVCIELSVHEIVFSRTTLIIVLTLCVAITGLSLLILTAVGYRAWIRHRLDKAARSHGRNSKYVQRISMMRKEVDNSYSRQYSGCLVNEPENPFLVPRSPVELMHSERVWEAPDVPVSVPMIEDERETRVKSLLFDNAKGQWFRRN
jgi:hypothetical protein